MPLCTRGRSPSRGIQPLSHDLLFPSPLRRRRGPTRRRSDHARRPFGHRQRCAGVEHVRLWLHRGYGERRAWRRGRRRDPLGPRVATERKLYGRLEVTDFVDLPCRRQGRDKDKTPSSDPRKTAGFRPWVLLSGPLLPAGLDRKAMAVVVTTAAARLRQVRWRKRPVAREFLVGRVERERGVAATHASSSRMRRTDVRPIASRRAISALLTPSRKSRRTCSDFRDAERGRPR